MAADNDRALNVFREIIRPLGLSETIKWGRPVFTDQGKNIVSIAGFKNHIALWFFNGALLSDKNNLLVNAQEGKTKAMRQWRFESVKEVENNASLIMEYVKEAIENQQKGKEIRPERNKELVIPEELVSVFSEQPDVKEAFQILTLGKQRDFAEYISTAKKTETRINRLEKIIPMIKQGIALNDKYNK